MTVSLVKPVKQNTKPASRKAQAALAGMAKKEPTSAVAHQVAEMREDYQVRFGRLVLTANLNAVSVTVSVSNGDARAAALAKHIENLWALTFQSMHDAYDFGRVAYEKCWGEDVENGLTLIGKLEPLPYEKTEMKIGSDGEYTGLRLKGSKTVDISAEDSWWLALDATALEPHGRSRFTGAPHRVYKDRKEALKMRGIFLKRFALGWLKGHVEATYEDTETGEIVDRREGVLDAIEDMRGGGTVLFDNKRVKKADGSEGDFAEDIEVMETPDKVEIVASSISAMDSEQLQSMGIPPKTVVEGEGIGSYAMISQQMRVLFAVVDDLLRQLVTSFQKYVIDKLVELNWYENAPIITIGYPSLTERPESLVVEIVKYILTTPQLSPLVTEGGVDVRQMFRDAGIPVTAKLDGLLDDPGRLTRGMPGVAPVPGVPVQQPAAGYSNEPQPRQFHLANDEPGESFFANVPTRRQLVDDALDSLSDLYGQLVNSVVNRHSALAAEIQKKIRSLQGRIAAAGHVLGMLSPWRPRLQSKPAGSPYQKPIRLALDDEGFEFPWLKDALSFLGNKRLMTPEQFEELDRDERAAAFSVPGVDDSKVLSDIRSAISESLREGEGLSAFRTRIEDTVALSRAQTETLFRTNTKQAYLAGMERTLAEPEVQEAFPYVQFAATADTRVRDSHWELDGMVVKRGTPEHQLMLRAASDHNCRCALIPISREQGEGMQIETMSDLPSGVRSLYA